MAIILSYDSERVRNFCIKEVIARQHFPHKVVDMLKKRLADLRALSQLSDLLAGNPRESSSLPPGEYIIDLCDGFCLIFCSSHPKTPIRPTGSVDWTNVSRIKILGIRKL